MNAYLLRWRTWLWWLIPLGALALLLAIETDWGRGLHRLPPPAPVIEPKPVTAALLPEYRIEGGLEGHSETVSRTLFNPTRRPAPTLAADNARRQMARGQFVLTGTAVAGERHIAFLKEVSGGKSRVVRQGEQLNGMLVASVTADRVKFTMGEEAEELILKVVAGPKTTTQPAPAAPVAAVPVTPGPGLPGAVPPVMTNTTGVPAVPAGRRILPTAVPAAVPPVVPAAVPAAAPVGGPASAFPGAATQAAPAAAPAATPAPASGAAQSTPAAVDPAWNEVYERMRQRNPQPSK